MTRSDHGTSRDTGRRSSALRPLAESATTPIPSEKANNWMRTRCVSARRWVPTGCRQENPAITTLLVPSLALGLVPVCLWLATGDTPCIATNPDFSLIFISFSVFIFLTPALSPHLPQLSLSRGPNPQSARLPLWRTPFFILQRKRWSTSMSRNIQV